MKESLTCEPKKSLEWKKNLKIQIYADGANLSEMVWAQENGIVDGFTTNPSLMRKAGITNYENFAKEVLSKIQDLPISFEVFSDDFDQMEEQARKIHDWGKNVNVKIPITDTKGSSSCPLIKKLTKDGIPLNITAIFTFEQVKDVAKVLEPGVFSIISVFAGRLADAGIDPIPLMQKSSSILENNSSAHLLWASTREILNIVQAESCGCKIITIPNDLLKKMNLLGKDAKALSLAAVNTFYQDGLKSNYSI